VARTTQPTGAAQPNRNHDAGPAASPIDKINIPAEAPEQVEVLVPRNDPPDRSAAIDIGDLAFRLRGDLVTVKLLSLRISRPEADGAPGGRKPRRRGPRRGSDNAAPQ
jgi:hypothetical protein